MAERTTTTQRTQIGVEATAGTGVAAGKLLQALSIEPQPQATIQTFRPAGQKFATITALGQEWMQANITGAATYTEIIYPLSSVLKKVSSAAAVTNADTAKKWVFTISPNAIDTVATFTVEQGDSVRAHKFTNGLVSAFGLNFTRQQIEVSGTMIGGAMVDGITLTASPTGIELVPILPTQVDVFIDSDYASLGTTQLDRAFVANLQIGDRFNPFWPLDSRLGASFGGTVEGTPTATLNLTVEANAAGMGYLTNMRAGSTVFARIQATGETIEVVDAPSATAKYSLTIDLALKVGSANQISDIDGIVGVQWPFTVVYDADWDKALEVTVINKIASL